MSQGMNGSPLLMVKDIRAGYGNKPILFDVSLSIGRGKIVALLGHNGAGKTTTLKTIVGLLPAHSGAISFDGVDITNRPCVENIRRGLAFVPQERAIFAQLSVRDNLLLGATVVHDRGETQKRLSQVEQLFPILWTQRNQIAGTLSGGQQRMLSVGMALMAGARLLLLDEPSLGLAPTVSQMLVETIKHLVESDGLSVLLVEQNVPLALKVAERIYVMRMGQIVVEETRDEMLQREHLWELF